MPGHRGKTSYQNISRSKEMWTKKCLFLHNLCWRTVRATTHTHMAFLPGRPWLQTSYHYLVSPHLWMTNDCLSSLFTIAVKFLLLQGHNQNWAFWKHKDFHTTNVKGELDHKIISRPLGTIIRGQTLFRIWWHSIFFENISANNFELLLSENLKPTS